MHDLYGDKPLHIAVTNGHESIAQLLIEKGADVRTEGKDGFTALHLAARLGHTSIVKLLLACHADISAAARVGWQPLHGAAIGGHEAALKILIQNGANINAPDHCQGRTPLHWAARGGEETAVKLLVTVGADIITDINGHSPLDLATENKHWSIVEFFAQQNVNLVTPYTFRSAVLGQQEASIKLFISLDADPLQLDDLGRNSMDWASLHPQTLEMMKLYCNCEYEATDKTITTRILRESIVHTAAAEKTATRVQGKNLYQLGRYLLYVDDHLEASTAFALWGSPSVNNTIICDSCGDKSQGDYYICKEYPAIDLCSSCMERYRRVQIFLCQGHTFFMSRHILLIRSLMGKSMPRASRDKSGFRGWQNLTAYPSNDLQTRPGQFGRIGPGYRFKMIWARVGS